jgi:hypothetical protein
MNEVITIIPHDNRAPALMLRKATTILNRSRKRSTGDSENNTEWDTSKI